MPTNTHFQEHWFKKIEEILLSSSLNPSLDKHFPFPWEEFENKLKELLNVSSLSFSSEFSSWTPNSNSSFLSFELSPILGTCHLETSFSDIKKLTTISLTPEPHQEIENFKDQELQQGYFLFIILHLLEILESFPVFKDISFRLLETESRPEHPCKCLDISLITPSKTIHTKLILPEVFLDHLKNYKPFQTLSFLENSSLQQQDFVLHFEIGKTTLAQEDWKCAKAGDFLVLDTSHYDPATHKGSLTIFLDTHPLLQGRIKPDGIKILDIIPSEENTTEDPLSEQSATIRVELQSLSMQLQKIIELNPESLIEIPPHPEQQVVLKKDHQIVGTGELLKLGNLTGVRILSLTHPLLEV